MTQKQSTKATPASDHISHSLLIRHLLIISAIILILGVIAHLSMQLFTRHGARRIVPDLTGLSLVEAERVIAENNLRLQINDSLFVAAYAGGIVLDQLPESGVEVKPDRTIYITINSFNQRRSIVPYVAEQSLRQAKNMLEIAGFEIAELIYKPDLATNYVLEAWLGDTQLTKESHIEAEIGSGITLHVGVSEDQQQVIIPLLIGQSLAEAKSRLWELGLNIGKIRLEEGINLLNRKDARIYLQQPTAEQEARLGDSVSLALTLDTEQVTAAHAAAVKLAHEVAEERARLERERDSLERLMNAPLASPVNRTDSIANSTANEFFHE